MPRPVLSAFVLLLLGLAPLAVPAADEIDERAEARLNRLQERFKAPTGDREPLRQDLLAFARIFPGTRYSRLANEMLGRLPSALDHLDPATIPALEKFSWQPKELVGILGEHRGRQGVAASCTAFNPDSSILASGGGTLLRIWDPATMRLKHLVTNGTYVYVMAFSRDGKLLATAGGTTVTVWTIPDGDKPPVARCTAGSGSAGIYGVAFSPNSKSVAVACYDNSTRIFAVGDKELKEQAIITGHIKPVGAVAYSPDGKTLATGGHDNTVRLWNATVEVPPEKGMLTGLSSTVSAMTFNPAGNTLAVACADGKIHLWSFPASGKPRVVFQGKTTGAVNALSFSATGQTLAAACQDGTARLWNVAQAKPVERAKLEGHVGYISGVAYSHDQKLLATAGSDWTVRTWDLTALPKPKERFEPWSHLSHVYSAAFSPDCATVATGSYDTILRLWDMDRPMPRTRNFLKPEISYLYAVAYSPNGKSLAASGNSGLIKQWESGTGKAQRTCTVGGVPSMLRYTPDGKHILTYYQTIAYLFDAASGQQEQTFTHPEKPINSLALSPDGKTLLTTTGTYLYDAQGKSVLRGGNYVYTDCKVRQWELETGKLTATIDGFTLPVYGANYTPDGRSALYYLLNDTQMRRREAANLMSSETKVFPGLPVGFTFSPDGRLVLGWVGGYGYKIFDAATGKVLHSVSLGEAIGSITFANDSRHLAVTLATGVVYILRLGPPANGKI